MQPLTDPETVRNRPETEFLTKTTELDKVEFEEKREHIEALDSHVVVGVHDEAGSVLMVDDGHHGWTLPAFPFEGGEDCVAVGQSGIEEVLDTGVDVQQTARVRRIEYTTRTARDTKENRDGGDVDAAGQGVVIYNVVLRANAVERDVASRDSAAHLDHMDALGWFDELPECVSDPVAEDARLFLD